MTRMQSVIAIGMSLLSSTAYCAKLPQHILYINQTSQLVSDVAPNEEKPANSEGEFGAGWWYSRQLERGVCFLYSNHSFLGDINVSWSKTDPGEVILTHVGRFAPGTKVSYRTDNTIEFELLDAPTGNMPISKVSADDFKLFNDLLMESEQVSVSYGYDSRTVSLNGYNEAFKEFSSCVTDSMNQNESAAASDAPPASTDTSSLPLASGANAGQQVLAELDDWRVVFSKDDNFATCTLMSEQNGKHFGLVITSDTTHPIELVFRKDSWNLQPGVENSLNVLVESMSKPFKIPVITTDFGIISELSKADPVARALVIRTFFAGVERFIDIGFPGSEGNWTYQLSTPRQLAEEVNKCSYMLKNTSSERDDTSPF